MASASATIAKKYRVATRTITKLLALNPDSAMKVVRDLESTVHTIEKDICDHDEFGNRDKQ